MSRINGRPLYRPADGTQWPDDDPRWSLPAVLFLRNGDQYALPELNLRDALGLCEVARELGDSIAGEIDPTEVEAVGYSLDDV